MRKITLNPSFGLNTPLAYADFKNNSIVVREAGEIKEFKAERTNIFNYRYTAEQLQAISEVNNVLEENSQPLMTEEEIEFLLYPFGKEKKLTAEELQHLAGFRVEKTIIPL